jgi:hypothetical protein
MMVLREAPKRTKVVMERPLLRNRMIEVEMERRTVLLKTIAHAYPMRMTTRRPSWTLREQAAAVGLRSIQL